MDTRWKKHNREAEQEEAEGVEHGAWWVTWLAAWTMLFYVVWAYVKVLSEMTVGVEKATLLTFWTTGKPLPKSLHADFISKFHVKKKKKIAKTNQLILAHAVHLLCYSNQFSGAWPVMAHLTKQACAFASHRQWWK